MTLLELLVVLVIASLMLALVAPNIGNVLPGSELKAFARQSAALLRELRSEAVSLSRVRSLVPDDELQAYRSGNQVLVSWPEGIEVVMREDEEFDFLRSPYSTEPALLFFPDGSSGGGELRITREGATAYVIAVDALSGRVSIRGQ
ncbi:hypothetical protein GCM10011352_30310 [Marinobacterium zhoushanense]|uniref:Type II secretion system protein H n=2 Tax=Marinobacterium zhoushanense TaxID=1679163 RepID=A0ABQ1KKK7_9GAMM|nr:hypothetical protein GCM10011352_30310 [Marinobacterium zhoushanense]